MSGPPAVRWAFVILLSDAEDRAGFRQLLEDVTLPGAAHRVTYLAPPTGGPQFFADQAAAQRTAASIPAGADLVYVVEDEPGLPDIVARNDGIFYVGIGSQRRAPAYQESERCSVFMSGGPLDFATVIMRDWSELVRPDDVLFDAGEALRMASLAVELPVGSPEGAAPDGKGQADRLFQLLWRTLPSAVLPVGRIVSDLWTTDDALGYRAFADAIVAFLRHRGTRPPLTVGIRAPWGAGKTSLMRMIRADLDPPGPDGSRSPIRLLASAEQPARPPRVEYLLRLARTRREPGATAGQQAFIDTAQRATVWFNPWMYQTGEQVWAALAHEIITQVTERMPMGEREEFWLRVNLSRIDREAVRRSVYRVLLGRLVTALLALVPFAVAAAALAAASASSAVVSAVLAAGSGVTGIAMLARAISLAREPVRDVLGSLVRWRDPMLVADEDATVPLVAIADPAYAARAGFFHFVRGDVGAVLGLVATAEQPLVVFIDDLDRCSPRVVAQVIEAVNVFLAGEFPNCLFVLAMEPQATVASIEVAYRDLNSVLRSAPGMGPSLGWRFLDKLVQLPLQLPPPHPASALPEYLESIDRLPASLTFKPARGGGTAAPAVPESMAPGPGQPSQPAADQDDAGGQADASQQVSQETLIDRITAAAENLDDISRVAEALRQQDGIPAETVIRAATTVFDARFKTTDLEVRRVMLDGLESLPGLNAREVKRFINLFRFYAVIGIRRRLAGFESATIREAATLAAIASQWPDVVGLAAGPAVLAALREGPTTRERASQLRLDGIDLARLTALAEFLRSDRNALTPGAMALLVG